MYRVDTAAWFGAGGEESGGVEVATASIRRKWVCGCAKAAAAVEVRAAGLRRPTNHVQKATVYYCPIGEVRGGTIILVKVCLHEAQDPHALMNMDGGAPEKRERQNMMRCNSSEKSFQLCL